MQDIPVNQDIPVEWGSNFTANNIANTSIGQLLLTKLTIIIIWNRIYKMTMNQAPGYLHWLIAWLIDWSFGQLIDWLIDHSIFLLFIGAFVCNYLCLWQFFLTAWQLFVCMLEAVVFYGMFPEKRSLVLGWAGMMAVIVVCCLLE